MTPAEVHALIVELIRRDILSRGWKAPFCLTIPEAHPSGLAPGRYRVNDLCQWSLESDGRGPSLLRGYKGTPPSPN